MGPHLRPTALYRPNGNLTLLYTTNVQDSCAVVCAGKYRERDAVDLADAVNDELALGFVDCSRFTVQSLQIAHKGIENGADATQLREAGSDVQAHASITAGHPENRVP